MKINYFFILLIIPLNFAFAKDCIDCIGKISAEVASNKKPMPELKEEIQVSLDMASKGAPVINSKVSRGPAVVTTEVSSKSSYQVAYCMRFETCQDWVDVETLIEDMEKSPYPESLKEFWTTPACHAPLKNDTPVPIIFNLTLDPVRGEKFPQTIFEYFVEDKKDMETWLKIINTKTSDGYTFLDFMQYNINKGKYNLSLPAAKRIIDYICKHGGVYSKYKDSTRCP